MRDFEKNNCKPVSRILYAPTGSASTIYLDRQSPARFYLPTLQHRRATRWAKALPFSLLVYLAFQHTRFIPAPCHQGAACALTARFHPYSMPGHGAVIFCDTRCPASPWDLLSHPLGGVPLCVVRTFLMTQPCWSPRWSDLQL